jgi:hypothetical protein
MKAEKIQLTKKEKTREIVKNWNRKYLLFTTYFSKNIFKN